jgi:thiol-disulfide isomerase/thioredoxin
MLMASFVSFEGANANTVIKGVAKNAGDREIRLIKIHDYFSYQEVEIASTKADKDGNFRLEFFISQPEYLIVSVGFKEASLFVEPAKNLEVEIDYQNRIENPGGTLPLQQPLDFYIKNEQDSAINQLIYDFDSISGALFPEAVVRMILYRRDFSRYDSLKQKVMHWAESTQKPYVFDYAEYRMAQIENLLYVESMNKLGEKLLAQREIQYRHPEYMNYLESFVVSYVPDKTPYISPNQVTRAINDDATYFHLDEMLGQDTVFRNEMLRELAALAFLKNLYFDQNYKRDNIISILDDLINDTKFDRHKEIAKSVKFEILRHEKSQEIIDFAFPTLGRDSIRFRDLQGRYLLINFYQSDCLACLLEMDIMKKIYEEHERDVYLLSISLDDNYSDFRQFVRSNDYQWNMAHFGFQFELLDYFELRTLPRFMLVGPEGTILRHYFPKLSNGGLQKINKLLEKRE